MMIVTVAVCYFLVVAAAATTNTTTTTDDEYEQQDVTTTSIFYRRIENGSEELRKVEVDSANVTSSPLVMEKEWDRKHGRLSILPQIYYNVTGVRQNQLSGIAQVGYFNKNRFNSNIHIAVKTNVGFYERSFNIDDYCFPLYFARVEYFKIIIYAGVDQNLLEFGFIGDLCQQGTQMFLDDKRVNIVAEKIQVRSKLFTFYPKLQPGMTNLPGCARTCNTTNSYVIRDCDNEIGWVLTYRYISITLGVVILVLVILIIVGIWKYQDLKSLVLRLGQSDYV